MHSVLSNYEGKAKELLAQMTLEEKAILCSGQNFWQTKGVPRLGIRPIMVTDGPHGLRKQAGNSDHLGINQSVPATCFPTAAATACSFDPELLREMGRALGEECLQEEVSVVLGPAANTKRSPLCGRNFEYFSEDPYLTGVMSSALIEGIQGQGIGTSMKHYAANNQETRRMVINAVVDERALREIYLAGYEMAVKQAQPWTVMCCYNQVNGEYGSQNRKLLTGILRGEWGFGGAVVTDWGAVVDRVQGLAAGLDLEMPYTGPANDEAILSAVQSGALPEAVLDTAVTRMLCLLLAAAEARRPGFRYDAAKHHALAQRVAANSAVLLKNDGGLLPLRPGMKLAVLGQFAKTPRYQGAGSSRINPIALDNLCDALTGRGTDFVYAPGYDLKAEAPNEQLLQEAAAVASGAEVAVVCIGLPDAYESEGFDREHLRLPDSHVALLRRVAAINPNTVVLLFGGGVVEMPWLSDAKALLMLYLGGEAGAKATADLLYGLVNPSGRLAESFPYKLEDNPSYAYFPGGEKTVEYRESIYVGYRYYDKAEVAVRFPFGFGLSYTSFSYRDLRLERRGEDVIATLKVRNTGPVAGADVVQLYVSQKSPSIFKPLRELKGFCKVFLQPGEEREVTIALPPRAFAYYHAKKRDWCVEAGAYTVEAAASSRDIRCSATIALPGEAPRSTAQPAAYETPGAPLSISAEAFAALYGSPLPPANRRIGEAYTDSSTLGEIAETRAGAAMLQQMQRQMAGLLGGKASADGDDSMVLMFRKMMGDMPVRALAMFSGGAMGPAQVQGMLNAINAEGGNPGEGA